MMIILNVAAKQVFPTCGQPCSFTCNEREMADCAKTLTQATGEPHVVFPFCEHCHKKIARFIDYRGLDVISKYKLCLTCASLTDEEFFGLIDQAPSGGNLIAVG